MAKRRKHNALGRSSAEGRHVRLYHWLTETPAWRSLDCVSRCIYVEIARRYAGEGSNNGRIPYSLRELSKALGVSKATAMRALERLQERGFVVQTKIGAFSVKNRQATEWRLTEFRCDITGEMATKDFTRWSPQKQNTVSPENPNGFPDETERVSR